MSVIIRPQVSETITVRIKAVGPQGIQGATGATGPAGAGVAAGGTAGQLLTKTDGTDYNTKWSTPAGGGDMLAATYDPTAKVGDAFDMENMVEGLTKKILTVAERAKLANTSNTNTGDNPGVTSVTGTAPVTSSGGTTPAIGMPAATNAAAGHATAAQVTALEAALPKVAGTITDIKETTHYHTTAGNITLDLSEGNIQRFILDAARQFAMPADPGALTESFVLMLDCNDFTPTWAASPAITWKTSDDAPATLVTTAGYINILVGIWDDVAAAWYVMLSSKSG